MKKLMIGTLALLTAMVFAGGNLAFSADAVSSQPHSQGQMAPDTMTKSETSATKPAEAKTKQTKKSKKAKKSRKSTQPEN